MPAIENCEIKFEIVSKTQFGDQIYVVGSILQLGMWDPRKGIALKTDPDNYPNWYSENPLILLKGSKFQFKFVKIALNGGQEWETFPDNINRKYRTRYQSVSLKGIWNDFSGREISTKKYASSNIFSNNELQVHKFKISGVFVPYENAGTSSDDSGFGEPNNKIIDKIVALQTEGQQAVSKEKNQKKHQSNLGHSIKKHRNATQKNESAGEENDDQQLVDSDQLIPKQRKKLLRPIDQLQLQQLDEIIDKGLPEQILYNDLKNQEEQNYLIKANYQASESQLSIKSTKQQYQQIQLKNNNKQSEQLDEAYDSQNQTNAYYQDQLESINMNANNNISNCDLGKDKILTNVNNDKKSQNTHLDRFNDQEQEILNYLNTSSILKSKSDFDSSSSKQINQKYPETDRIANDTFLPNKNQDQGEENLKKLSLSNVFVQEGDSSINKSPSLGLLKDNETSLTKSNNALMSTHKWRQQNNNHILNGEKNSEIKEVNEENIQSCQSDVIFAEKLFQSSGHTLQQLFKERQLNSKEKCVNKYSYITSENDIVFEASEDLLVNMSNKDELCISTFFLPVNVSYDPKTDTIKDSLIESSLYFHFTNAYPSIKWVGVLPNFPKIPDNLQERVTAQLIQKYRFFPIFIEDELLDSFLNQFCANIYDVVMKNQFDVTQLRNFEFNSKIAEEVKMVSFKFAQQISRMIDDDTNIMVADYRIIFAIVYLCQVRGKKLNISYFHDSQFPDQEKLQLLPFGEKIINAILCSNMVSFSTFENAQNFLNYIKLKLKLQFESVRGNLRLIYMGNQIIIHIRNPGVNVKMIKTIKNSSAFEEQVNKIKSTSINSDTQLVIIGIDTLHENSKLVLKIKLFHRFLQNHPEIKAQLIQIILPDPYDYSKNTNNFGNSSLQSRINQAANQTQKQFRNNNALQIIYSNMSLSERVVYMSLGDIFLRTSIQSESEVYAQEYALSTSKSGFSLLNKFGSQQHKQISSFMTFNPQSYFEFEKSLQEIRSLPLALREKVLMKELDILNSFSTGVWIEKTIAELKKNAKFMCQANMTGFNKGINFKKVAHQANFRKFNLHEAASLYQKTGKRIIILGYVGTLVPFDKYMYIQAEEHQVRRNHQKPSSKIIENLKNLCADKQNMVYIVTELSIDFMDEWFADVQGLGLICENGYLHKVIQENEKASNSWERLMTLDLSWKSLVYKIMESYAIKTQGSSVEVKDSIVVWKYNSVQIDFGQKQAQQMVIQLKQVLSSLTYLEVSHYGETVEVRPSQMNKGIVVELLIERKILECGGVDFILILGSSTSDEDMFCACQMLSRNRKFQNTKLRPFYVTIGVKPSNAYYYITFEDVEKVLELLEMAQSFLPYP